MRVWPQVGILSRALLATTGVLHAYPIVASSDVLVTMAGVGCVEQIETEYQ